MTSLKLACMFLNSSVGGILMVTLKAWVIVANPYRVYKVSCKLRKEFLSWFGIWFMIRFSLVIIIQASPIYGCVKNGRLL